MKTSTSAAFNPVRLFPSTNGWFSAMRKAYAAAMWKRSPVTARALSCGKELSASRSRSVRRQRFRVAFA
jgi:hypothetical protein